MMKKAFFSCLAFALVSSSSLAQDILSEQIWELIEDQNSDGWADPGEIVELTINISMNCKNRQEISVRNIMEDPNLTLIPGTVETSGGTIKKGNEANDDIVIINGISFQPPWSEASITFHASIGDDLDDSVFSISNSSQIEGSFGILETNATSVKLKNSQKVSYSGVQIPQWIFIIPILIFAVFGFDLIRRNIPKLSY